MKLLFVLVFKRRSFNLLHYAHDEVASSNKRIKDMNIAAAEGFPKLFV